MTVYMKLSSDIYRLPIAVADSVAELCKMTGQSKNTVASNISRARKSDDKRFACWQVVEIDEEDEE